MSSSSSTVAQYEVVDMETGKNYAQISNADAFNMFVIG
jgi:hypothetical protein